LLFILKRKSLKILRFAQDDKEVAQDDKEVAQGDKKSFFSGFGYRR
jgi:hypothetical protein